MKLRDSEADKERYREQLIATERRMDRLQSKAAASLNPTSQQSTQPSGGAPAEAPENAVKPEAAQDKMPLTSSVRVHMHDIRLSILTSVYCCWLAS